MFKYYNLLLIFSIFVSNISNICFNNLSYYNVQSLVVLKNWTMPHNHMKCPFYHMSLNKIIQFNEFTSPIVRSVFNTHDLILLSPLHISPSFECRWVVDVMYIIMHGLRVLYCNDLTMANLGHAMQNIPTYELQKKRKYFLSFIRF
jgi:hypothetical protein